MTHTHTGAGRGRQLATKVPEVTLFFWVIKILATTVGETVADLLSGLGLGLGGTTVLLTALFLVVLAVQVRARGYVPALYWLTVVLVSVVGTLITDDLTDALGVSLVVSTVVFAIALAATFAAWWAGEGTLSIHTVVTGRREAFYWLAILFTFALGTAVGDLVDERLGLGYWPTALVVAVLVAAVAVSHLVFRANAVLAFWVAYVLTRPLGASLGDGLSQDRSDGGLGLGTTVTSLVLLAAILAVVTYLAVSRRDQLPPVTAEPTAAGR